MISLLREPHHSNLNGGIATEKLASRVGASLLKSIGMDDLIAPTMDDYASLMTKSATDGEWFSKIKEQLTRSRESAPLFDTERWVENLESALLEIVATNRKGKKNYDVYVIDDRSL